MYAIEIGKPMYKKSMYDKVHAVLQLVGVNILVNLTLFITWNKTQYKFGDQ